MEAAQARPPVISIEVDDGIAILHYFEIIGMIFQNLTSHYLLSSPERHHQGFSCRG